MPNCNYCYSDNGRRCLNCEDFKVGMANHRIQEEAKKISTKDKDEKTREETKKKTK